MTNANPTEVLDVTLRILSLFGWGFVIATTWKLSAVFNQSKHVVKWAEEWAKRIEENHLTHIEENTEKTMRLMEAQMPALHTSVQELARMRQDLHDHELDDARVQTEIRNHMQAVREDIQNLDRAR